MTTLQLQQQLLIIVLLQLSTFLTERQLLLPRLAIAQLDEIQPPRSIAGELQPEPHLLPIFLCTNLIVVHHDTSLDPPIIFGSGHNYNTRLSTRFICPEHCQLSATKWHIVTQWWNDLPEGMITSASASHLYDYILCNYDQCVSCECIFLLDFLVCIMCVCMYVVL